MKILKNAIFFPLYLLFGFFIYALLFFYEFPLIIFNIFSTTKKDKIG